MAILLVEKNQNEVISAPVIREEIGGGRVQISGRIGSIEARDVSLLLRVPERWLRQWKLLRSAPLAPAWELKILHEV